MKIYIIMVDFDGNMRSSCDTPVKAFNSEEAAKEYILKNTSSEGVGKSCCGGYFCKIVGVDLEIS